MMGNIIYRLIRFAVRTMAYIPYPLGQFKGRVLGFLAYLIPLSRKNVALENIRQSFPAMSGPETKRLLRNVYIHFGRMLFEIPHILRLTPEGLHEYVTFEGLENLEAAAAKGKGVFVLTAHFGNWELMAAAVTIGWRSTAVIARPADFEPLDRILNELRSRFGTEIIPSRRSMRRILNALKENKLIGVLLDQNVDWYEGVFARFLGRWACTNKGLALMAQKIGSPVVPAFSVRDKTGGYRVIFEKEADLIRTGDKTADLETNTQILTTMIEKYVRTYPDHWFWFHKRWKTRNYCPLAAGPPGLVKQEF
jgi:Kdo2-lipid IVA lauroyltransferase/acyltransferase